LLTDPDLPLHALPVLVPRLLLHLVVLLERALERVLERANLQLACLKVGVALGTPLVLVVEPEDPGPDRVGHALGLGRELGEPSGRVGLLVVVGRRETARVELRDVINVGLEVLDLVLD